MNITTQQNDAINSKGKTIVSASAGSGKTFVMIKKLVAAIEKGVDLDSVLAVTFTKKAAAQMKEKLRSAIIENMEKADEGERARLKVQLSKISSASISTIHSFCANLLRTYFYAVGIDGTFDIISSDDAQAKDFKNRAIDTMFDRYYAEGDQNFNLLLSFYRKKRSDAHLKNLILDAYEQLRINADYLALLDEADNVYTDEGFERLKLELGQCHKQRFLTLKRAVKSFADNFQSPHPDYCKIFDEMQLSLEMAADSGIFDPLPPLSASRKPKDLTEEAKLAGERYKKFRDDVSKKYGDVRRGICEEQIEKQRFFDSGKIAKAFAAVLRQFDAEYTAVKRDENKLDYNDLEHLTLALLADSEVRKEINGKYSCVFVDEYQDVNPVQESIISLVGGKNVFLVGDVKQAIYGFRGSKSQFFAEKYSLFEGGEGNSLRLSNNFRSSDGVLNFVNRLFSGIMTEESCGIDYKNANMMISGGGYPEGFGSAEIHVFGEEQSMVEAPHVYSVKADGRKGGHSREGLAVLEIVKRELRSRHYSYDKQTGTYVSVDTQPGDICILTRKNNARANDIVRALTDAGYCVAGAQESNILNRPEVKQMADILSYIDNAAQDVAFVTAALSPLGGLTCDELAAIRIAAKSSGRLPFRECCKKYSLRFNDGIALKLEKFYKKTDELRGLAEVFTAAEIIDKILEDSGLEASLASGGGQKLKNVRRFAAEGIGISVSALLAKLREGYEISAPAAASSDSIKIMTMHASKGLEFPVVIISDICAEFKGRENNELPFDGQFGFVHKYFDSESMVTYDTLARRLALERSRREELKNELNLFYVACTRAMCRLHIMAKQVKSYDIIKASKAERYSELFEVGDYSPEYMSGLTEIEGEKSITLISSPDPNVKEQIESKFMQGYAHEHSINLPVKSSASAILRLSEEDFCPRSYELFSGEGETGTERGTAYHRFLELCDFNVKDRAGIVAQLDKFELSGSISSAQRSLLNEDDLVCILNMPVFAELKGARLFREQEFLCRLPANAILDTDADDGVLVQGAIDLLAQTRSGIKIIDYKYSHKTDEQLIATYSRQLALYKKAVALIMHVDENSIGTAIVNIFAKRQIVL